jgi:elongation factor Ts
MAISATQVKALRDITAAGFMECKAALTDADGDIDKAVTFLRTRGQANAAKRAGRTTTQGVVGAYIHPGGQVGVLVEVDCESDFVARTDDFQALVKEIAMHVAAANPLYTSRDKVPAEEINHERAIYQSQFKDSDKPPAVVAKIIEGKINSYYTQIVLIDQPSIRDPKTTIGELVKATISKLGENITVSKFSRFKVGETVE